MKPVLLPLLLVIIFMAGGCKDGASIRVVNRSDHNLYVQVENGSEVVIPGQGEHNWDIDTDTESFLSGHVEKDVTVRIVGETYHIFDEWEEVYTDSAQMVLRAGETRNVYINPNRASIKIVNQSSQAMNGAVLYRHNFVNASTVAVLGELQPGELIFKRVDYATPTTQFYYYAIVQMADGTVYEFGGPDSVLDKDQQLLITLEDPEPQG